MNRPIGIYPERRKRSAPNMIVILTSVLLVGLAIWGGGTYASARTGESPDPFIPALPHFLAGALGVAAVLIGQRWRQLAIARILLIVAAAVLGYTVFRFQYTGTWAWISLIIPAVLLAGSALFLRPVPPPVDQQIGSRA